jgi:hypothetical protein
VLMFFNTKKNLLLLLFFSTRIAYAQISGELQANANFYMRDSNIKAFDNPLYDNTLSGGESWLALRYNGPDDLNINVRIDGFQHSNLLNPTNVYTGAGIGMYNISKTWNGLTITAGHIYDQIGTGIIYRAYEDRALLIDNATFGLQAKYNFGDNLSVKAFTGQVRNLFDRYKPIIKGANAEYDMDIKKAHLTSGFGIVNRTMDKASMDNVVSRINALPFESRFTPKYNYVAATVYNTLNLGNFSWYVEGAYKTAEAINDANNVIINSNGTVIYTTLGYAIPKFGINASAKRTENFALRTSPNEPALRSFTNWQPIIAAIRPQRVIARYTPQSMDLSEQSANVNAVFTPNEKYTYNASYTFINDLQGNKLYREIFADAEIRSISKMIIHAGIQVLDYNQFVYQQKGKQNEIFTAQTLFAEVVYKLSEKKSLKAEAQFMNGRGDYGSWVYALLEYDIAPKWAFAISDMYNLSSTANLVIHPGLKNAHYPNVFVAYTQNAHRFSLQYVKQVEGINCTGGVCRYEPAFSGVKFGITSSF